jgi:PAS domain S-box-containing protein
MDRDFIHIVDEDQLWHIVYMHEELSVSEDITGLLNAFDFPAVIINEHYAISFANRTFCDLAGQELTQLQSQSFLNFLSSNDGKTELDRAKSKTVTKFQPITLKMLWGLNADDAVNCSWHVSTLANLPGLKEDTEAHFMLTAESFGLHQELVDALHDAQQQLRSVVALEPNSIITISEEGTIHTFSPSAEEMFGYSADEVIGRNVKILMPSPYQEEHDTYLQHYIKTGRKKIIGVGREIIAERKDGTSFPIFLSVDEVVQGKARYFTGVIRELTTRKRLEAMQQSYQQLLEALVTGADIKEVLTVLSKSCSTIIPGTSINIVVADGRRRKLRSRGADGFTEKFPALMEEIANSPDLCPCSDCYHKGDIVVVTDIDASIYSDSWNAAINSSGFKSCWAYPILSKHSQPIGAVCLYLKEQRGPSEGDVAVLKDMARLAALGIERFHDQELLRQSQKMDSIGQLTGGVAHDFNNLLTIIQGNLELLKGSPKSHEEAESLDDALSAAEQGSELTQRLLTFARRQSISPECIDVNATITNLSRMLSRTLGKSITLTTSLAQDLWSVEVDISQFQDAIVNLCINARDAMAGGGTLSITTENFDYSSSSPLLNIDMPQGPYVKVAITDNGIGIDEDLLKHVFDPFFTTKEVGHGSGLGLSMVFGFAKRAGGAVTVYSEIDVGTTFSLYLPKAKLSENTTAVRAQPDNSVPTGTETILVVEDDDRVRKVTVQRLTKLGYNIIEAVNGTEGLEKFLNTKNIDLVFTDLIMPGTINGRDMGEKIMDAKPETKILYTSGFADPSIIEGGSSIERQLLRKPYTLSELATRIREILT